MSTHTQKTKTAARAPLGHFVPRDALRLMRELLQRGDRASVDRMLATILAQHPHIATHADLVGK